LIIAVRLNAKHV